MRKYRIAGLFMAFALFGSTTSMAGWNQRDTGWGYEKADGAMAAQEWVQDNERWYYLNADGNMMTGWYQDGAQVWYYLKADGAMACNEWIEENGQAYYLNGSGAWEPDAQSAAAEEAADGGYVEGFNPAIDN